MADIEQAHGPGLRGAAAISGRALYDGRIDPAEALALLRFVRRETV